MKKKINNQEIIKKVQNPVLNNDIKFHSSKLIALANVVAVENRISFTKGNYCWTLGPMYETPEEINYLKSLNGSVEDYFKGLF